MDTQTFVKKVLLDEVKTMYDAGIRMHLLATICHGIEVCGVFLDPLPYKAKGQGRKRFTKAINQLFSREYQSANVSVDLYGQLRSHISHTMIPGKYVNVGYGDGSTHLLIRDDQLNLNLDTLYKDYISAVDRLLDRMKTGELKNKTIDLASVEKIIQDEKS